MSHSKVLPVVRAVDVGHGHIKYVTDHDVDTGEMLCDSFPSRSPRGGGVDLTAGVMSKLDTVTVEVGGRLYEVGKKVISAAGARDASEYLSRDFATSDAYMARLYGALNYMYPHLGGHKIDWLILGLPNLTLSTMSQPLLERVRGEHIINTSGLKIEIGNVRILPQPLGAFFDYGVRQNNFADLRKRVSLIVDPGYNTFDWLLCEGLAPNAARSGSIERGMAGVVRAIAEEILRDYDAAGSANINSVINRLDYALCNQEPYRLYGKEIDLDKYLKAGDTIIEQAINALEQSVGAGNEIDTIYIAGGGASFYHKALQARYPHHTVVQINEPQFANVRGFQIVGTNWAQSAQRASIG